MPTLQNNFRVRKSFAKIQKIIDIPNLINIQKQSYDQFLQADVPPEKREDVGLQGVFKSVFPIRDFNETSSLEFVSYHLEKPKYDVDECHQRDLTYQAPIKVVVRLVVWDKDEETGAQSIRDVKEQEVYFGEIPLMTENGTFIINGTERVIVSQLHRSPGVFFESTPSKSYYLGKIIPYRGSWVEFEYETAKNILYVRIDRKRKFLATIFLRALGLKSDEEIIRAFYKTDRLSIDGKKVFWNVSDNIVGLKISKDITHPKTKEVLLHAGKKITSSVYNHIKQAKVERFEVNPEDLEGAFAVGDVVDTNTGEVIVETNNELTQNIIRSIIDAGVPEVPVFFPERDDIGVVLRQTVRKDTIKTPQEALIEIYRKLRPGDPPTLETATALFEGMFFDARKYDFSRVGRLKFNIKLDLSTPLEKRILEPADFYAVITYLLKLRKNIGQVDDIDHLGNRRVRAVGELLENQFRIGLVRMERAIKEKMSVYQEMVTAMPHDLINAKPVIAAVREFFGSSQLSQFMDQTNPLSEITHKRRLSALGPGGLSRERAGFEVRDVHPTHYGRICPIETPEGPNIGLISSLSCYARINEYGFIESPYRKVENGIVKDYHRITAKGDSQFELGQVVEKSELEKALRSLRKAGKKVRLPDDEPHPFYLTAWEEDKGVIAQANVRIDEEGRIVEERVTARVIRESKFVHRDEVQFIDVSPKQLVSVAASLIPFLENDDANRALMGSNMQRQAVPLIKTNAPLVGTGMESVVARDSGAAITAKRTGIVDQVDAKRIVIRTTEETDPTKSGV